ncbi:DUF3857 domain-containing protein [Chitinophaga filiformis]|uniref:DUF3857 domain-containing protein n=1 Tax=Chitinophaga filiformis TaxID=104663 RepID=A0A1G7LQ28_CHIFI|nr:DUF3857 domain-containing protein [Chitinophaga filiformis]SDF51100.1 protein of unknown function [Chitinophaga filiformis]
MHKYKFVFLSAFLLSTGYQALAQSKQEREYQEEATQVKQEIWDAKDPAFARTDIPEKYSNESAVIIAMNFTLGADHSRRQDHIAMTLHERIKLQDKAALENYSEFNLQKLKRGGWSSGTRLTSFMGIRVIKADGQQRDIDMKDAVNVKDEQDDKKQKIAISDLQVGDIIDFYVRMNKDASSFYSDPDPLDFSIGEKYPMLDFSLNVNITRKMGVSWRYLNDDPSELKNSKDGDDYVFSIHKTDVPKVTDERWFYEQRALPTLRLAYNGLKNTEFTNGMNEDRIRRFLTYEIISVNAAYPSLAAIVRGFPDLLEDYASRTGVRKKDIDKRTIAELAFYYIRYASLYKETGIGSSIEVGQQRKTYTPREHYTANVFRQLLIRYDIPTVLAAAVPRRVGTLQDVVSLDDLDYFIIAYPDDKPMYCFMTNMLSYPDELPTQLEGQQAYTVSVSGSSKEKDASFKKISLPMSTADQNVDEEKINVNFAADNMQQLSIDRIIRAKGQYRYNYIDMLLYEDMLSEERKNLHVSSTRDEDLLATGAYRKRSNEFDIAFSKARKDMDETVSANIASEYGTKPTAVTYFKVAELGLEKQNKPLTMHESFTMDGFVKKAGNNYMLDIGKLITEQIALSNEERKRTYDVNMPFPRTVSYDILVNIPAGYKLEGAENLNKSVNNDTGSFESSTKMEDGKLIVTIKKVYKHHHESSVNWPQMIAFMDAASDFNKQKVLLKKI